MSDAAASPTPASQAPSNPAAPSSASDSLEVIRKFAETYAQRTGTYFCSDPGVTAVVLAGLAKNKDELGGALCPCRHYEDKQAEVSRPSGTVPACRCGNARNATACCFSPKTTHFAGTASRLPSMKSKPLLPAETAE